MSKLTVIAFGRVKAGHEAGLAEALKAGQAKSLQEPGTEVYKVHISPDDPREFGFYEVYVDDAAFDAHEKGEGLATVVAFVKDKLEGELIIKKFREL
ncbi:hypothetical protein PUNSTDRAFT_142902 [Punctularia strigosozonata HHB-11173 SS5]|uniref:uncharacterized protein n=1 Tax=Punctularia strigosozonata (strain HHB-11173) TaxID=741275 RepID=UPI000441639D|nr:uncharacterized protein PUNSTDRAFT_142902 [Punctularia strigosozonata HHB-11173 SS5]EIN11040.1 hypothetical protein PUNSTDRAFT_142902 [Punctularia strigosozonata HHB-11173 SS5]